MPPEMATIMYQNQHHVVATKPTTATLIKRKSAVELLAETKSFYVKSEAVRDTKQATPSRPPVTNASPSRCCVLRPSPSLRRPRSSGGAIQMQLRQLLVVPPTDVATVVVVPPPPQYSTCHKSLPDLSRTPSHSGGSSSEPPPPKRPPTTTRSSNNKKPPLRSKSDVGDRHPPPPPPPRPPPPLIEQFFDQLGLTCESYERLAGLDCGGEWSGGGDETADLLSPVSFSDISTVDSDERNNTQIGGFFGWTDDSTPVCRISEPPSIVERNARIIKWLCNCRKAHNK